MRPGRTTLIVPPSPAAAKLARRAARIKWQQDLSAEVMDAILLCVTEVVANAVEHGAPPITVVLDEVDTDLVIEVRDAGRGQPRATSATATDERGRGLALVDALAASWSTTKGSEGTSVTMRFLPTG